MSQPYQPVSTIQALNWCRKHCATVRFWSDGDVTVEGHHPDPPPGATHSFYGEGDTLMIAVCEASRNAWEKGWNLSAREAKKRSGR
jgi:hypothetical protein